MKYSWLFTVVHVVWTLKLLPKMHSKLWKPVEWLAPSKCPLAHPLFSPPQKTLAKIYRIQPLVEYCRNSFDISLTKKTKKPLLKGKDVLKESTKAKPKANAKQKKKSPKKKAKAKKEKEDSGTSSSEVSTSHDSMPSLVTDPDDEGLRVPENWHPPLDELRDALGENE